MRTLLSRKPVILALLVAVFSSLLWAADAPATPIQVTLSPTSWTTVALPAMALGITAHDGVLWVTGANEMLARSDDQGRTWNVVHFKKDGQLLFAIAFAGNDGWAMGSQGMELHSSDAGAHWKRMGNAPGNVIRVAAADARHIMASSPEGFLYSSNGGKSWVAKEVPVPKQISPQVYSVVGVAMPDPGHAGALLEMPLVSATPGDVPQIFVSTSNGGKTWQMLEFSSSIHFSHLSSDVNGYEASGSRQTDTVSESVVFHSADGLHWSTVPAKPEMHWCQGSQCLLSGSSSWVQIDHDTKAYWGTPVFPTMMNHWAAIAGVMCVVGNGLQCAEAQKLAAAPPEPAHSPADRPVRLKPHDKIKAAKCLRCPAPTYPMQDRRGWIRGDVLLHALIAKSGRIKDLTLLAAPSASLAQAAMKTVGDWVYAPTMVNGHPAEVFTEITVHYVLNH